MVVLTTGTNVGSLPYSTLAEEEFPQEGVQYAKANAYILVAKNGTTDPVSEQTAASAIVFLFCRMWNRFSISTLRKPLLHLMFRQKEIQVTYTKELYTLKLP